MSKSSVYNVVQTEEQFLVFRTLLKEGVPRSHFRSSKDDILGVRINIDNTKIKPIL